MIAYGKWESLGLWRGKEILLFLLFAFGRMSVSHVDRISDTAEPRLAQLMDSFGMRNSSVKFLV